MARLIDADAAVELLRSLGSRDYRRKEGTIADAMKMLSHAAYTPTIDPESLIPHGRWEGTADGYADGELVCDMWECSECGYDADGADEKPEWKYCPNCGAKMDLEEA